MKLLKKNAKIYVAACTLLGVVVFVLNAAQFRPKNPLLFLIYLLAAAAVSLLNLRISIGRGVMSAGLLLVLLGNLELSLPEVLIIGCVATALQELRIAGFRANARELVYRVGSVAVSIAAAYNAYHLVPALRQNPFFPALLLASSLVFFFHYFIAAAILRDERTPLKAFYRNRMYWLLPWFVAAGYLACMISSTSQQTGVPAAVLALPVLFVVDQGYRFYMAGVERERQHAADLEAVHLRTIEALAVAIEAKDDATHMHLRRVQVCAMEIGREMGLGIPELKALQAAALLHDVGKLAIPEHIISKPGRLTPEEFEKMKIHPVVGSEILERMQLPYPVASIVRTHHEKWDGTGYPAGLAGEEIPIGARILSAVDCLDALASDRPYRRAVPLDEAMQKVAAEAGKSYDPKVVEVLQRRYVELDRLARAQVTAGDRSWISTNIHVEKGLEPATGLQNLAAAVRGDAPASYDRFLDSIASASQEDQLLRELSSELGSTLSMDETLAAVAKCTGRIVPYDTIVVFVLSGDKLSPVHVSGVNSGLFSSKEFAVGEGLSGWVAENQKPIINGNPSVEPPYCGGAQSVNVLRSALSVPLQGQNGPVGVLSVYSPSPDAFTREHLRILQSLSMKVGMSIENALRYHSAQNSATTDYLTALPNARSLFLHLEQELARAARDHSNVAVMLCDLDGFKQVNDSLGHLKGNEVLRLVANGLRETCRDSDYIARMGGDEFVIVMPGLDPDAFRARTSRFCSIAEGAGLRASAPQVLSMSMGVAVFPKDGATAEALLAEADRRMYQSKKEQKSSNTLVVQAGAGVIAGLQGQEAKDAGANLDYTQRAGAP
jgi:diguanylate cyclase (GGDEF)-like protein/putative nucleotidyltransferase with HDIG domain